MNSNLELKVGDNAPDFTLESTEGKTVNIKDFLGKNIVLYFYPRDFTPGCTQEACDFNLAINEFTKLNTIILGISPDKIDSHNKFIVKHSLDFSLLSDVNKETAKKYGVWKEKNMYGIKRWSIVRSTFIINTDSKIVQIYNKVKVDGHTETVINSIKDNL